VGKGETGRERWRKKIWEEKMCRREGWERERLREGKVGRDCAVQKILLKSLGPGPSLTQHDPCCPHPQEQRNVALALTRSGFDLA